VHSYTETDSGLVQFGNARWASCRSVMLGNDDEIKDTIGFFVRFCGTVSVRTKKFRCQLDDGN